MNQREREVGNEQRNKAEMYMREMMKKLEQTQQGRAELEHRVRALEAKLEEAQRELAESRRDAEERVDEL